MVNPGVFRPDRVIEFDGETTTFGALCAKYTAYSRSWLRDAVVSGCKNRDDLTRRWSKAKSASASTSGSKSKVALKDFAFSPRNKNAPRTNDHAKDRPAAGRNAKTDPGA